MTDFIVIKKIMRKYEQCYAISFDNLYKMEKFLERHTVPKLN